MLSLEVRPTQASDVLAHWNAHGYAIFPGLVDPMVCDAISREVIDRTGPKRRRLGSLASVDVLHGRHIGRLLRAAEAPDEVFNGPFKLNNLFAESEAVRRGMFDDTLVDALSALLGAPPLAINSLNFVYGSQQPAHIDSWYMPPPKENSMAVASICLEDVDPEAGPLFYYPGSHRIPPYRFSHGGLNAIEAEMPACRAYIDAQVAERGLQKQIFLGKKGDVFVWHCQLLHGGSPIADSRRTRRSLVVHYWGADSVSSDRIRRFGENKLALDRDYWQVDNGPAVGEVNESAAAEVVARITTSSAAAKPAEGLRAAFETWEAHGESLESVEARIHDGVPASQLHARADGYLQAFENFFSAVRPREGAAMMEIGSGLGYVMQAALRRYRPRQLIGLDVAAGMIAHARRRLARDGIDDSAVSFLHYDGIDVPLPSESLDHVYSVAALQHAPRPYCFRAMVEAFRVVKPDGWVCIHLLSHAHFRDHMTPALFAAEIDQQIRGTTGHWHHYYSAEELESIVRYGIGAPTIQVRELMGSLFLCYSKRR